MSITRPPPALACDAHIHVYDERFPVQGTRRVMPDATADDYRRAIRERLGLARAVVVTPTNYVTDNRVTLDAIARLGADATRGVAVLHPDVADAELRALHEGGIRGIRFTLYAEATAVTTWDMIEPLAARIAPLGWHVQLHARAEQIVAHAALIERLPCPLVFDHMARSGSDGGAGSAAAEALDVVTQCLARGDTWVKLSGAYLDAAGPDWAASVPIARRLVELAPDRMVWGSDWPHPTETTVRPDDAALLALLARWIPDAAVRQRVLVDNPARLYGFDDA